MVNITQIHRIILLKCVITVTFSLLIWMIFSKTTAISLLIGGLIAVVGSVIYRMVAYRKNAYVAATILVKRHFLAEGIKMGLTIILFALTFVLFPRIISITLFLGYILASTAYWLELIWKFKDS